MSDVPLKDLLAEPSLRTARKLVIAPSVQAGVALRTALARGGLSLAGLTVSTPDGLAARIVEWADPERGAATFGASTLVVETACALHALEEAENRPLIRSARTVARSIAEARLAGLDTDRYGRLAIGDVGRVATTVRRRLERAWSDTGRRDAAALLREAAERLADLPAELLPELLLVMDEVDVPGTTFRLLDAVRRRVPRAYRLGMRDAERPPAFTAADRLDWPVAIRGGEGPEAPVRFVEAVGAEAEVRAALRIVADGGWPLDQVELAYPGHEPYLSLLRDVTERGQVPATFAAGIALTDTRPGQTVRGMLRWLAEGLPSGRLVAMLRAGMLRLPGDDPASTRARLLAGYLDGIRVGHGVDAYLAALDRTPGAPYDEGFRSLLRRVPPGGTVRPQELAAFLRDVLRDFAPDPAGEDPDRVREEIATRIGEMGEAEGTAPVRPLAGQFLALLDGVFVQARSARPGRLHVVPLPGAGHSGRPFLVVLGMDQDAFARSVAEDAIIPDEHRRPSGDGDAPVLAESSAHRARPGWWLRRAMARASGGTVLVRSTYDLAADRELYPSSAWIALGGTAETVVPERHAGQARPGVGEAPGRPLTLQEALLAARRDPLSRKHLARLAPGLERGVVAGAAAGGDAWTAWDGALERAHDPWATGSAVSPTRLETLAACPYRYFLQYVLQVSPPETRDDEVWMQPTDKGLLVHEAFQAYVQDWIDTGRPGPAEALQAELEGRLAAFVELHEPPSPAVEHRIRADLAAAARILMQDVERARREGRVPVAVEMAFGSAGARGDGAEAEPWVLSLDGLSLSLRGYVDRVDRLSDGRLVVIDYKTGGASGFRGDDLGAGGTRLQWALYATAVADLLGAPVARSGYLFVSPREMGLDLSEPPPAPEMLAARLRGLALLPREGLFPQSAGSDACRWCDFRRVCGDLDQRKAAIRDKVAATDPESPLRPALAAWAHCPKPS